MMQLPKETLGIKKGDRVKIVNPHNSKLPDKEVTIYKIEKVVQIKISVIDEGGDLSYINKSDIKQILSSR